MCGLLGLNDQLVDDRMVMAGALLRGVGVGD